MTLKARTKDCEGCEGVIHEKPKATEREWKARRFCSRGCQKPKTKGLIPRIIDSYLSGKTQSEVAKMYGITTMNVCNIMARHNVPVRSQTVDFTKEQKDMIRLELSKGSTLVKILEKLPCSMTTLRKLIADEEYIKGTTSKEKESIGDTLSEQLRSIAVNPTGSIWYQL